MWPHRRQPTRLPHPWDSPGKNTGVGCHFLLQCMKVKSESEVAQSCLTLSDPMDCSLPGSSIHGIFQARVLEWGAIAFYSVMVGYKKTFSQTNSLSLGDASLGTQFLIFYITAYKFFSSKLWYLFLQFVKLPPLRFFCIKLEKRSVKFHCLKHHMLAHTYIVWSCIK